LDRIAANLAGRPVVIGDGVAGLMTALNLVPQPVIVLAKAPLGSSAASAWAQGGVAAALGTTMNPRSTSAIRSLRAMGYAIGTWSNASPVPLMTPSSRSLAMVSSSTAMPTAHLMSVLRLRIVDDASFMPAATLPGGRSCAPLLLPSVARQLLWCSKKSRQLVCWCRMVA
jgi:hypothetical protein